MLLPRSALPLPDAVRQAVAAEKNLSETAFLECADDDSDDFSACTRFRLRWFTPAIEVPLCGHATLASAAALLFGEGNPTSQLAFETLSGELRVSRKHATDSSGNSGGVGSTRGGELSMDLPLVPASAADVPPGMQAGSALVQVRSGDVSGRSFMRGRDGRAYVQCAACGAGMHASAVSVRCHAQLLRPLLPACLQPGRLLWVTCPCARWCTRPRCGTS